MQESKVISQKRERERKYREITGKSRVLNKRKYEEMEKVKDLRASTISR
jgi:hypothetical protein